ncbi:hypothetical protein BrE312_0129 [Brenneria sp. EniD312]|nr:hypothetical protein BrE312_0129 [Brenneria sp. EniD312]
MKWVSSYEHWRNPPPAGKPQILALVKSRAEQHR